MTQYLSTKIRVVSFFLIVLVVFLHSFNLSVNFDESTLVINKGYNSFIQYFVSKGLALVAVPLFFLISGFLFFKNINNGKFNDFYLKVKKRFQTILIPYLTWSIIGIIFLLILQSFPFSKNYFSGELIEDYSILKLTKTIFINPIPYQLWFMKDLFILMILSPIIFKLLKLFKIYFLLCLFIFWVVNFQFVIVVNYSLLFFALGAFIQLFNVDVSGVVSKKKTFLLLFLWILILLIKTTLFNSGFLNQNVIWYIQILSIIIGVISVWLAYDLVYKYLNFSKLFFLPYTFFLYASHEPVLLILKKTIYSFGHSEMFSLVNYFIAPTLTIVVCVVAGYLINKILPKSYRILTGGR